MHKVRDITYYEALEFVADFDFDSIPTLTAPRGNPRGRQKILYKDVICTFDIETTRVPDLDQSFMYIWQMCIGDNVIIGRTWEEFKLLLSEFKLHLHDTERVVFFVHNLSYEFQFLAGIYLFNKDDVFLIDSRKVLKATMYDHFEFRCSYLHSNMSLAQYTKKMGVKHGKLSGKKFDYSKIRTPYTELSEYELRYCLDDVIGLREAIEKEMELDKDTLYTFPLTSTGYVRREVKRAMRGYSYEAIKALQPDLKLYELLHDAFRGGNTHANRFYAGMILHNVKSTDRSSSYPDVMCNERFPMSPFKYVGKCSGDKIMDLISEDQALIMRVRITDVTLIDPYWGAPYLAINKCTYVGAVKDNGRIISADIIETAITDVDLQIILSEYQFTNIEYWDVYTSKYGKLPRCFIDCIERYYRNKTELKNVEGQEIYYGKSKALLNSLYGLCVQRILREPIIFDGKEYTTDESWDKQKAFDKAISHPFNSYAWGVWITALSRLRLEEGLRIVHESPNAYFIYTDTDSIKYQGDLDLTKYNNTRIIDSKRSGAYATDPKGKTHYMGVFEDEGEYTDFITFGAKKYAYVKDGKTGVTISGVNKELGAKEIDKAGGLSALREGFTFKEAGGTEAKYNDDPLSDGIDTITIDGCKIKITRNLCIKESTYTLGLTSDYKRLLEDSQRTLSEY